MKPLNIFWYLNILIAEQYFILQNRFNELFISALNKL